MERKEKWETGTRTNFSSHPPPYKLVYPWRPNQCCKVPDFRLQVCSLAVAEESSILGPKTMAPHAVVQQQTGR